MKKMRKIIDFLLIPIYAIFRDLDLDNSFKPFYLKRIVYEWRDWLNNLRSI